MIFAVAMLVLLVCVLWGVLWQFRLAPSPFTRVGRWIFAAAMVVETFDPGLSAFGHFIFGCLAVWVVVCTVALSMKPST